MPSHRTALVREQPCSAAVFYTNLSHMNRLVAALILLLLFSNLVRGQGRFVVHEWGTFTTLEGSDGKFLSGLYHEEEKLPSFVQHEGEEYNNGLNKGFYECKNVTVKMETPVLYFYSDTSRLVNVRVVNIGRAEFVDGRMRRNG